MTKVLLTFWHTLLLLLLMMVASYAHVGTASQTSSHHRPPGVLSLLPSSSQPAASSPINAAPPKSSSFSTSVKSSSPISSTTPLEEHKSPFTYQNLISSVSGYSSSPRSTSSISPSFISSTFHSNGKLQSSRDEHRRVDSKAGERTSVKKRKTLSSMTEKDKKILQVVEMMFLKNVGLQARPRISQEFAVPEYMLDLYQRRVQTRKGTNTFLQMKGNGPIAANTVRSFVHTDHESPDCRPPLCSRVHFDVKTIPEEETLTGAELRIYVGGPHRTAVSKQREGMPSAVARLEVHQILKPSSSASTVGNSEAITRLIDTRIVRVGGSKNEQLNSTWHSFDVHPAVMRWKRLGHAHNHGLELRLVPLATSSQPTASAMAVKTQPSSTHLAMDDHVRVRRSTSLPVKDWALQRPLLVVFTDDGSSSSTSSSSSPLSSSSSSSNIKNSRSRRSASPSSTSVRKGKTTLLRRSRRNPSPSSSGDKNDRQRRKEERKERKKRKNKNRRRNRRRRKKKKKEKKKKKKKQRNKTGNENICRRHGLYVNFKKVGWDDWIVAPSGYNAFYCHGECMAPIPDFAKASNHAMLQARVYTVFPQNVSAVCCVPIKLSPISMLYKDEHGRTVIKNYYDMSVDQCGCV